MRRPIPVLFCLLFAVAGFGIWRGKDLSEKTAPSIAGKSAAAAAKPALDAKADVAREPVVQEAPLPEETPLGGEVAGSYDARAVIAAGWQSAGGA